MNSDDCIGKITSKSMSLYAVFIKKKNSKLIKKGGLFLVKKWEIQVSIFMIMLTRFLERIFNASRQTDLKYFYVMFPTQSSTFISRLTLELIWKKKLQEKKLKLFIWKKKLKLVRCRRAHNVKIIEYIDLKFWRQEWKFC